MSSYDHQLEVGDRVKALVNAGEVEYSGQRGTIRKITASGIYVVFDNTDFGGGWFSRHELRKMKL